MSFEKHGQWKFEKRGSKDVAIAKVTITVPTQWVVPINKYMETHGYRNLAELIRNEFLRKIALGEL